MKFYLVTDGAGSPVGCYYMQHLAVGVAKVRGEGHEVTCYDVPVTAETIRRLLGSEGGYVTSMRRVYPTQNGLGA